MIHDIVNKACESIDLKTASSNNIRSQIWVKSLANQLRYHYPVESNYRVFSRNHNCNKNAFRLNEFLYDISVVRVEKIKSPLGKLLEYPAEAIWQIESEFNEKDSRSTIIDFSKLLVGSAKNKMMILPQGGRIESWARKVLVGTRGKAIGSMYLCFLPHPGRWSNGQRLCASVEKLWLS